ncbi:MAG TPA: HNH endonuclease [Alteraurantiacibacter sp.]
MTERKPWTRRDQVLVLELYARTPFGKMHRTNPDVIELAAFLERTPSSVAMKLANYAGLDDSLDRKGLDGASKADREIWAEFFEDPEALLQVARSIRSISGDWSEPDDPEPTGFREGEEVLRMVKTPKNQALFRGMVLSAYESTCAITGLNHPRLLVASHIVPWRTNKAARLDPRNGICLNPLHDRAFDEGLITLNKDMSVRCSPSFIFPNAVRDLFEGQAARLPTKFRPLPEYLEYHRDSVFQFR